MLDGVELLAKMDCYDQCQASTARRRGRSCRVNGGLNARKVGNLGHLIAFGGQQVRIATAQPIRGTDDCNLVRHFFVAKEVKIDVRSAGNETGVFAAVSACA